MGARETTIKWALANHCQLQGRVILFSKLSLHCEHIAVESIIKVYFQFACLLRANSERWAFDYNQGVLISSAVDGLRTEKPSGGIAELIPPRLICFILCISNSHLYLYCICLYFP